jgi:5-keto-L-gluconate epimerase
MRVGMRTATPQVKTPSLHYRNGDLPHSLEVLARLGYDSVELDVKDPREVDVQQMHRLLNDNGLDWCGIGTGRILVEDGLSFTDPRPAVRREAVQRMCSLIELGAEFGAIPMIGLARHDNQGLNDPQTSWKLMMEGIAACAERAEKCRHLAMLENITRYMHPVMHTTAQVISVIEEINSPAIKLMYDTYHAFLEERSLYGSLVAAAPHLCYVHISDGNREAPGWGLIDYSEVIGVLAALGYRGPLVCEVLMTPNPQTVAEHSMQFLDSLLQKHGVAREKKA